MSTLLRVACYSGYACGIFMALVRFFSKKADGDFDNWDGDKLVFYTVFSVCLWPLMFFIAGAEVIGKRFSKARKLAADKNEVKELRAKNEQLLSELTFAKANVPMKDYRRTT